MNLILNNLTHSIANVVEGNTITNPAHIDKRGKFDFIVSNPPFKVDFSEYRDPVANNPAYNDRFFAGVPTIPNKKKESMSIYLLFIQHILWMLGDFGKAAIVVPTGFITAQSGIEKTIRERLVEKKWLKGVVSMPSNIFAATGTNVSVIFIDKANQDNKIILVDASKLGEKIKEGKNQRTVLSLEEERQIVESFSGDKDVDDFSVRPKIEEVKQKNYSLSAGQYFEVKVQHIDITEDEFKNRIANYQTELDNLFASSDKLGQTIKNNLGKLNYGK